MGLRLRKSINLPLGFRINLSKSGIGYSWGFPGYRTTKLATGSTRQTYSLPGTGISYVEQNGNEKNQKKYNSDSKLITGNTSLFENIPIDDITKSDPILNEINKTLMLNRLSNMLLLLTLFVFIHPAFIIFLILGIILKIVISSKMKVKLYYEFDDDSRKMYDSLKEILIVLSQSKKIWQINSKTKVYNVKYNAGASNTVDRNNAFIMSRLPWFIKANIDIYGLNLKNQKVYFTPDRILVFKPFRNVFGCTYRDMYFGIESQRFVESEKVYSDAQIVDYAWAFSNKDGSRDLRFNNNRRYPVCKYGRLTLKSPNGIYTLIDFSNHDLAEIIQSKMILFGNQFNKILALTKLQKENAEDEIKKKENSKTIINEMSEVKNDEIVDPLYEEIMEFVISTGKASASLLQRRFKLGYNQAARMIDLLEERGIIGPMNGSKPREVLVKISNKDGE